MQAERKALNQHQRKARRREPKAPAPQSAEGGYLEDDKPWYTGHEEDIDARTCAEDADGKARYVRRLHRRRAFFFCDMLQASGVPPRGTNVGTEVGQALASKSYTQPS